MCAFINNTGHHGYIGFCKSSCLKKIKGEGFPKGVVWEQGCIQRHMCHWEQRHSESERQTDRVELGQKTSSCPAGMAELCSWYSLPLLPFETDTGDEGEGTWTVLLDRSLNTL